MVDGISLPMSIESADCPTAECAVDLNPNCPAELQYRDASGNIVGCKSDCLVDPNPGNSPSCCSGSHNTPATCPPSGVPHYSYFKNNCPNSYVYGTFLLLFLILPSVCALVTLLRPRFARRSLLCQPRFLVRCGVDTRLHSLERRGQEKSVEQRLQRGLG